MELSVINIGNVKAIILFQIILEKYNIGDKIELVLEDGYIILQPIPTPRKNWEKHLSKCTKMAMSSY